MAVTVDTNVLVYAANADDEAFEEARGLLDRLARGPELLYLFWPTVMGFLRIATHPGIFSRPLSCEAATKAVDALLERPHVRTPSERAGFWTAYKATADRDSRGNDVPDAYLAALMRQHGVSVIYTRDRGFRRYTGLDVRDPFATVSQ